MAGFVRDTVTGVAVEVVEAAAVAGVTRTGRDGAVGTAIADDTVEVGAVAAVEDEAEVDVDCDVTDAATVTGALGAGTAGGACCCCCWRNCCCK